MKKINNILSLLALGLGITTMASCNSNKTSESESSNISQQESLQPSENPSGNPSTSEKITLTGFDVEAEVNASFGNSFTLPTFTPIDQNNNIYSVKVKVVCDGKEVAIVNNKIDINSMKDYVVTFTVEGLDNVSKVMVIKVKDLVKPTITLEKLNTFYSVNEQITLPKASIIDNVDEDLVCKFQVTKDNQVILDNIQNAFTLSETGKYTLVATCVDSNGNEGKETIDFIIRSTPSKGEIEDFKDALAFDCVKAINNNDGLAIKSELVSFKGKDAIKITSTNANDEAVKYPGLSLTPRISKEQAQTLLDDGFKFVSVEYYIDYNAKRNIYQKWDGQKSYATTLNTWATINFPLDTFVANYDKIASGDASLFYIGNEAAYVEDGICAVFDFYVSSIYVTKNINTDITFADNGINNEASCNSQIEVSKITASYLDATFSYEYFDSNGNPLEVTDGKITLNNPGIYEIVATANEKCYSGSATYQIVVKATLEQVNSLVNEILSASDISLMQEKANTLKAYYATLSTEDKNKVNAFEYVRATNLLTLKEDVIYYFDETAGKDQVTLQYDAKNTEVSTKDGVSYVTDVKYGNEKGSTKFTFKDVPSEWFSPYTIVLSTPAIEDLSAYQYIRFYVQGYCYKADRPITFAITVNDKRITPTINPVEAKNGNWVEVLVPVSELTGNIKIKVYTHNGNDYYGSVWNDPTRMYVYLSNIKGVKAYNDFTFASDFTLNTRYETNTTLSLEKMFASASNGSVNATKYVLVKPDGSEVEINFTSEITLIEEGRYELKAIIDNGKYYNTICKEFVVADPDNGITYLAKVKSDIVTRGYGTDKVPSTYLTEFEGVKNVIKASTIVADGASTNAYKWPGFNLKSRLSLEELATLKAKGYTKFVLPIYVTGNKEQDVVLNDKTEIVARITPNKWNYIEISVDKLTATSMDYFAYIYNSGKGNPTEAEKDIVYYISDIYLKQEDMLKVFDNNETSLSNFIVKEGSNVMTGATLDNEVVYGKETASVKYVIANSDTYAAAFYFNQDFAFEGYEKAYVNMRVSNSSNNKLAFTLYNGDSRIIDLRHVYLTQDEWYRVEVPTALFSNLNTLNIRVVCNLWGSAIPAGTTFNFSNVYVEKSDSLVISTVAYGKDIVRAAYVEEFNGENHVFKASTDTKLLASSNSWKYPGFKVFMPYSFEKLQELKEQGYTALNVRLYVEDSSQSTQDVLWGLSPNDKIATIETNKWQDVALSIDTLIANYSSYFANYQTNNSQYLFYINNFKYGSSAAYINIYTSTVTFVK